jgi:hypothetical protein
MSQPSSIPSSFAPAATHAAAAAAAAAPFAAARSLSELSVPDVALIVSCRGEAFEGYSSAIIRNGFGGDVIDMLDMNDVTQLMESMGFSTNHKLLLKATIAGWKKNPDAAFQALALAKDTAAKKAAAAQKKVCRSTVSSLATGTPAKPFFFPGCRTSQS